MANKAKGEVSFEVGEASYVLRFSTNALCELEDALDMGVNAVAAQLSDPSTMRMKTVRVVFWAGLRDRNPGLTLQLAGELITEITMQKAMELIGKAFELAFQEPSKARPQKPGQVTPANEAAGTGLLS